MYKTISTLMWLVLMSPILASRETKYWRWTLETESSQVKEGSGHQNDGSEYNGKSTNTRIKRRRLLHFSHREKKGGGGATRDRCISARIIN